MTSFHHQPEAQHPKSSAIHNDAGRLPHLLAQSGHALLHCKCLLLTQSGRAHELDPGQCYRSLRGLKLNTAAVPLEGGRLLD